MTDLGAADDLAGDHATPTGVLVRPDGVVAWASDTADIASGNEMFGALADVVAEVLTGRTTHGFMPMNPNPVAIRLHADVAQAVQSGNAHAAHQAMTSIISEAITSMLQDS